MMTQACHWFSDLLDSPSLGSEAWWGDIARRGTPILRDGYGLFLWKGQASQVGFDLNGITDHHAKQFARLMNIPHSNVWFSCQKIPEDFIGGYSFFPLDGRGSSPTNLDDFSDYRERWNALVPNMVADPMNPWGSVRGYWGPISPCCGINVPVPFASPLQPATYGVPASSVQNSSPFVQSTSWNSRVLTDTREIYSWDTGVIEPKMPSDLVILFDGKIWGANMPLADALQRATSAKRIPPAHYVAIDSANAAQRHQDLSCSEDFLQAIMEELIPQHCKLSPRRIIFVGQSLGGLAAMFGAMRYPKLIHGVVSQSGSFWWPNHEQMSELFRDNAKRVNFELPIAKNIPMIANECKLYISAGRFECDMLAVSQQMYQRVKSAGYSARFTSYSGGHDLFAWAADMIEGLEFVLG